MTSHYAPSVKAIEPLTGRGLGKSEVQGETVRSRHPHDNESAGSTMCIVWDWYDTPPSDTIKETLRRALYCWQYWRDVSKLVCTTLRKNVSLQAVKNISGIIVSKPQNR